MERNRNREDREDQFIREQVKNAGFVEPSEQFEAEVMQRIVAEKHIARPLIDTAGWVVFVVVLLMSMLGLYWLSADLFDLSRLSDGISLNWQLNWSFGPSVIAGVVFAFLFWVQLLYVTRLKVTN